MDVVQAYFALRLEQKNEDACQLLAPDATFETPNDKVAGVADILAFFNANPTPKVGAVCITGILVPV